MANFRRPRSRIVWARGISNGKLPTTEVRDHNFAIYTTSVWFIQYILWSLEDMYGLLSTSTQSWRAYCCSSGLSRCHARVSYLFQISGVLVGALLEHGDA